MKVVLNLVPVKYFLIKNNLLKALWHQNKNINETLSDDEHMQTVDKFFDNFKSNDQVFRAQYLEIQLN